MEVTRTAGIKGALVHDFLVSYGGAERAFQAIAELYPEAPIYTLLASPELVEKYFKGRDIRVSWLGKLPRWIRKRYRLFLPFFPSAVEAFDLREFDLVVSSSSAWGKGIVTRLNTKHIAYLHSPMRYAWDYHEQYLSELGARGKFSLFTRALLSYLRVWDRQAAERPDFLIANSRYTEARIEKYYRRESVVIYPPVSFTETPRIVTESIRKRDYFLVVSRLTRSKKVDVVVEAFNKLGLPLVIVGSGPEEESLRKKANRNITFTGFVEDSRLVELYAGARALLFPSEEDFGLAAAEALSFGTPVIAFEYGGIREIVESGKTGELYHAQTPEIAAEGVRRFLKNEGKYDIDFMKASVAHLTKERFQEEMRRFLEEYV